MAIISYETFEPKSDDTYATRMALIEFATVKPSGYLQRRGVVAEELQDMMVHKIRAYYTKENRPEPVILWRSVGAQTWLIVGDMSTDIPDTLPENFN